jgi:hypothetical protein
LEGSTYFLLFDKLEHGAFCTDGPSHTFCISWFRGRLSATQASRLRSAPLVPHYCSFSITRHVAGVWLMALLSIFTSAQRPLMFLLSGSIALVKSQQILLMRNRHLALWSHVIYEDSLLMQEE